MTATVDTLVIFGVTGDLARRMLLPSLYYLERDGLLDPKLRIIGVARSALDDERFRAMAHESIVERKEGVDHPAWRRLAERLAYSSVDAEKPSSFAALSRRTGERNVYYLSLSPQHYGGACANLETAGLATPQSRIVVEKPIGHDLASCRAINACLQHAFGEARVFRIDHYLGKETVQNLLALRFANVLFEPLWNRTCIDHVQITVAESIGVEGRRAYYDAYGALRDMAQNHILQLLCLVAMEPPSKLDPDAVRDEKTKVLRSLRPIHRRDAASKTVRGQYAAGEIDGTPVPAYAEESGGGESGTETFVAIEAEIENWRWAGVPFYLRTGKRLGTRHTQIVIQFLGVPHSAFGNGDLIPNRLTITLQPEERISLLLMNKTPGLTAEGMRLSPLSLNLSLTDAFRSERRRIAYERLLLDALAGNATLFVRGDEVEAAWAWIDGIERAWQEAAIPVEYYAAGSRGPLAADALIASRGYSWAE
ncbi:MAG TPA: glucose-6-phosphate dehydrogenase [Rhizomicrobium sp.]|jgi:glucose-6-phosphate 1-dehydrogenase|nr:glucose-6-phosphate dehydrogenase [Rhizomicrobium sp.]